MRPILASVGPFVLLFAFLYAAFGVASPFLPALIEFKGVPAEQIGMMFGAATAIRLLSAPVAGRIADQTHAVRVTLAVCCGGAALTALAYLPASGFWPLLAVSLLHAYALAPTTNLADALAVVASRRQGFEYGWARGAGSAAFIAALIAGGFVVSAFGLGVVVVLQAVLMLTVPFALRLRQTRDTQTAARDCARPSIPRRCQTSSRCAATPRIGFQERQALDLSAPPPCCAATALWRRRWLPAASPRRPTRSVFTVRSQPWTSPPRYLHCATRSLRGRALPSRRSVRALQQGQCVPSRPPGSAARWWSSLMQADRRRDRRDISGMNDQVRPT